MHIVLAALLFLGAAFGAHQAPTGPCASPIFNDGLVDCVTTVYFDDDIPAGTAIIRAAVISVHEFESADLATAAYASHREVYARRADLAPLDIPIEEAEESTVYRVTHYSGTSHLAILLKGEFFYIALLEKVSDRSCHRALNEFLAADTPPEKIDGIERSDV